MKLKPSWHISIDMGLLMPLSPMIATPLFSVPSAFLKGALAVICCAALQYSLYFLSIKHSDSKAGQRIDTFEVYKLEDISSSSQPVGLNDGGLLLYALLSGGDYSVSDNISYALFMVLIIFSLDFSAVVQRLHMALHGQHWELIS